MGETRRDVEAAPPAAGQRGRPAAYIGREMAAGRAPVEVSRDALVLLGDMEDLLGEKVLNYARRATA
ncbi:hypothetical protein ACFWBV_26015 [Streptomyces sp. NPDC060030]|uniref:hypothetical protein n=1 Tax=Streptomyces sp. NPDC060030 TaxID=3347042 RepID=UPI0036C6F547